MMIGMANSIERGFPVPAVPATSPTKIVVVVEELWITAVATNPRRRPAIGSDTVEMSCSAKPWPAMVKAVLISLMLQKKT